MSQLTQIGIWSPDGADHDDATLKSDSQSLNITLWFRSIYHSTYVAAITFPDTFLLPLYISRGAIYHLITSSTSVSPMKFYLQGSAGHQKIYSAISRLSLYLP